MTGGQVRCQRWWRRVPSWRPANEGGFHAARYETVEIDWRAASRFVVTHHYSGAFPSAVLRYGMVDRWHNQLVGVCVLGNGMTPAVLTNPFPDLTPGRESLELSRLVLLDEVPANAESWFVGQALGQACERGVRGVVMYSDPNARTTPAGAVMPGHLGIIYQALNCWYVGPSRPRYEDHLPDGTVLPERAASKVRGAEQGCYGTVRRLVQLGADDPGDLTTMTASRRSEWLTSALAAAGARHVKRSGKHRYLLATGTRAQRRRTYAGVPLERYGLYPKHPTIGAGEPR